MGLPMIPSPMNPILSMPLLPARSKSSLQVIGLP
jgi:hypothetical protein